MSDIKFSQKGGEGDETKVSFMSGTPKVVTEEEKGKNIILVQWKMSN